MSEESPNTRISPQTQPSLHEQIADAVRTVRETTPLAQSFTNFVTINLVANAQLAAGGAAAMSFLPDDIIDTATISGADYINVGTLLNAVRAAVPAMLAGGGGKIVNVGAGAGQKGVAQMGAYSASKSAVIRITEAMAGELREQNINVNCVLPSIIDTPPNRAAMPDADPKKWVAPGDLAAVITFLCSEQARAVHGVALPVVGLS